MRRLRITSPARRDFADIDSYISEQSGYGAADAVIDKLYRRCERIASLPGTLGTARPDLIPDLRSIPESGYIIFFRYTDAAVEIVNVLHGSRDVVTWYDTGDDR